MKPKEFDWQEIWRVKIKKKKKKKNKKKKTALPQIPKLTIIKKYRLIATNFAHASGIAASERMPLGALARSVSDNKNAKNLKAGFQYKK